MSKSNIALGEFSPRVSRIWCGVLLLLATPTVASDEVIVRGVQLLQRKCYACHGPEKAENDLRLDSATALRRGGQRGATIDAQQPEHSLLLQSIDGRSSELQMPPEDPLTKAEIELLRQWVALGAVWPASTNTAASTKPTADHDAHLEPGPTLGDAWSDPHNPITQLFGEERLGLWSLKPLVEPLVPELPAEQATWAQTELDHFVLARFLAAGREPPSRVAPRELLRRVSFDLTGLPPTSQLQTEFLQGQLSLAEVVEQLLDSPRFGEHWGRMWLDLARYSDSNGFDWDEFRPQAWRYRDYVIRAFNADKPFDQFVREQLAGDELVAGPPRSVAEQDALLATGFLRMGPHDNAAKLFNEQDRSRDELLTDLVETTGSALLGLTLSCCRCHDHKHDPLSQVDHFRLRACFAGVQFADELPINLADEQTQIAEHNSEIDRQLERIEQRRQQLTATLNERFLETAQPTPNNSNATESERLAEAKQSAENKESPVAKPRPLEELLTIATSEEREELESLQQQTKEQQQQRRAFDTALLMVDAADPIPSTFVLYQGDYKAPRDAVVPGVLSVFDPNPLTPATPQRQTSSGRRLALANWIVSVDNPLTARVFVNRVWQHLLGQGIVRSSGDFGIAGTPPDEPELLDWLAAEFMQRRWSVKQLIRLIVLSSVYQQQATYDAAPAEVAHLHRHPRRLTAEQLRDALLHVSGLLTSQAGGPPKWPELPTEVLEANPAFLDDNREKTKGWYPSPGHESYCRSIFLVQKRNTRVPLLEIFDQPENSVCCVQRLSSVVAPQALALLNSPEANAAARQLASRITSSDLSTAEQVNLAFAIVFQREPTTSEHRSCMSLLQQTNAVELCRALLNTNEFAYLD